ncbi:hypothetical protein CBOM_00057 [Ceraceosorus bombacis]|uniref:Acyl-CoA thioesterase n=1 Tax=Ceraceosorus bombacis TaxID=401625 RepID=A0A0P1B8Q5_9BASI|nr:hypothetical protein CBOM_00057 [Ceraceosorus bombacis]
MSFDFLSMIQLIADSDPAVRPARFHTNYNPVKMGNTADIAYGGCAIAVAVNAAIASVEAERQKRDSSASAKGKSTAPKSKAVYALSGNYLGPARADRPFIVDVESLRDTKTFTTILVRLKQRLDSGEERSCLVTIVDFVARSDLPEAQRNILTYNAAPPKVAHHSDLPLASEWQQQRVRDNLVPQKALDMSIVFFGRFMDIVNSKYPDDSILGPSLYGLLRDFETQQEHLSIPEKNSTDWFQSSVNLNEREHGDYTATNALLPISTYAANISLASFFLDGALSFLSLSFSHRWLADAGACSSLDFSLRFHVDDFDLARWHLREVKTHVSTHERTYNEARMWDEQGRLVATMTQVGVLKKLPERSQKQAKL